MIPVPPQLRIMLLLKLNPVKEIGCGSVCGQGGRKSKASRDRIWKDNGRYLGVLDITLQ